MPIATSPSPNNLRRVSSDSSLESRNHKATSIAKSSINRCSRDYSFIEDALRQGDIIGPGLLLQGESVELIHIPSVPPRYGQPPATNLQVVRKLGAGSYAVVYLVREILDPLTDGALPSTSDRLGREYAIKCLSKVGYDADALDAQMVEATIHQTLPTHPNIATLYRTFQTQSYLLLLLEYVPGEDLFYFLEQARDHEEWMASNPSAAPPTPSLLTSLPPNQLLSYRRLRLIASMFSQMCDAVALCHREGVYHRDIKPENFIVTHLRTNENERHVVVKLTDFGLATRDVESADVDCGSAPYMSYECRNNIAPTYSTAPADVWSLGIVLLNMLYHHNPWADTSTGACQSFTYYLEQPVAFFMQRFPGMTIAVAQFFAHHIFSLLDPDPTKPVTRISAHDFGVWARDLPIHLGPDSRRDPRIAFRTIQPPSSPGSGTPYTTAPTTATNSRRTGAVSIDQMLPYEHGRESFESDRASFRDKAPPSLSISTHQPTVAIESDAESDEEGTKSRSASGNSAGARRRRRAARGKGNGTPTTGNITPVLHTPQNEHLDQLATALQMRAREISKAAEPTPPVPIPVPVTPAPLLKKKKSTKWENIFRRDSGSDAEYVTPVIAEQLANIELPSTRQHPALQAPESALYHPPVPRTARAVHVNNLIRSLSPAVPASSSASITSKSSAGSAQSHEERRGRKKGRKQDISPSSARRTPSAPNERQWRQNAGADAPPPVPTTPAWYHYVKSRNPLQHQDVLALPPPPPVPEVPVEYRNSQAQIVRQPLPPPQSPSPTTSMYTSSVRRSITPSLRSVSTVTSSTSSNWRSSAWSRYAGSVRSVSTAATSVSSGSSWREGDRERPKTNVKDMDGIPWELDELPRHQFRKPKEYVPKPSPQPKHHDQQPRFPALAMHLDTIAEGAVNKPRRRAKSGTGAAPSSMSPSAEPPVDGFDHSFATAEGSTSSGAAIRKKTSKSRLWWGRKGGT